MMHRVVSWGRPGAGAAVVAQLPGQPDHAVLFAYDAGKPLVGRTGGEAPLAAARRVGLFLDPHGVTEDSSDVWKLFEAAVDWSVASESKH